MISKAPAGGIVFDIARALTYIPHFLRLRRATMVFPFDFLVNLMLVRKALLQPNLESGTVVECGTWRGGMAAALMELGGKSRSYLFCDSFAGLPPPELIDGKEALDWAADTNGPRYFNNCYATEEEFRSVMRNAGFADTAYQLIVGYYCDTLQKIDVPPVSVLRLDSDWFKSTMECLETFWPHVIPGGLVIVDDYYHWAGCRRALHAFLAKHERPEAIFRFPGTGFAYLWKEI